jgi:hypothetical protein
VTDRRDLPISATLRTPWLRTYHGILHRWALLWPAISLTWSLQWSTLDGSVSSAGIALTWTPRPAAPTAYQRRTVEATYQRNIALRRQRRLAQLAAQRDNHASVPEAPYDDLRAALRRAAETLRAEAETAYLRRRQEETLRD